MIKNTFFLLLLFFVACTKETSPQLPERPVQNANIDTSLLRDVWWRRFDSSMLVKFNSNGVHYYIKRHPITDPLFTDTTEISSWNWTSDSTFASASANFFGNWGIEKLKNDTFVFGQNNPNGPPGFTYRGYTFVKL